MNIYVRNETPTIQLQLKKNNSCTCPTINLPSFMKIIKLSFKKKHPNPPDFLQRFPAKLQPLKVSPRRALTDFWKLKSAAQRRHLRTKSHEHDDKLLGYKTDTCNMCEVIRNTLPSRFCCLIETLWWNYTVCESVWIWRQRSFCLNLRGEDLRPQVLVAVDQSNGNHEDYLISQIVYCLVMGQTEGASTNGNMIAIGEIQLDPTSKFYLGIADISSFGGLKLRSLQLILQYLLGF